MYEKRDVFTFRHFSVAHAKSTMKVGTDAMILGAWAPVLKDTRSILDVGTGSGVLALMMAQRTNAQITAIDIDRESIAEAHENFRLSAWPDRLTARQISLQDFLSSENKKFDFIISNPPYFQNSLLPADDRNKIAKHNIGLTLNEFFYCSHQLLSNSGNLAVILPVNDAQALLKIAGANHLHLKQKLVIFPTENKPPNRTAMCFDRKTKSGGVTSELIIRNSNGHYTHDYKRLTEDFHAEGYLV